MHQTLFAFYSSNQIGHGCKKRHKRSIGITLLFCFLVYPLLVLVFVYFWKSPTKVQETLPILSFEPGLQPEVQAKDYGDCVSTIKDPAQDLALMHQAFLNPLRAIIRRNEVERDEFFDFDQGFLTLICNSTYPNFPDGHVYIGDHGMVTYHTKPVLEKSESYTLSKFDTAVAIVRNEFANPYWVIIDLLDIYSICIKFGVFPSDVTVLWLDAHPPTFIDNLWSLIFKEAISLSDFRKGPYRVFAKKLILRPNRVNSDALNQKIARNSKLGIIRDNLFGRLKLKPKNKDCNNVTILIVWRRDYVNHPGNKAGVIGRKIRNEAEVVTWMREAWAALPGRAPGAGVEIKGVQLELLSVEEQVRLISQSDVFWAMHGAGHAMSVFLPPGRVVVELMPLDKLSNWHMQHLSTLSDHPHLTYLVPDEDPDDPEHAYLVSQKVVTNSIQAISQKLCPALQKNDKRTDDFDSHE